MVEKDAGSDSEIFQLGLYDCFLEVAVESQNLPVVFEPLGLDSRDVVIIGRLAGSCQILGGLRFKRL
jgi:hypothetical protein